MRVHASDLPVGGDALSSHMEGRRDRTHRISKEALPVRPFPLTDVQESRFRWRVRWWIRWEPGPGGGPHGWRDILVRLDGVGTAGIGDFEQWERWEEKAKYRKRWRHCPPARPPGCLPGGRAGWLGWGAERRGRDAGGGAQAWLPRSRDGRSSRSSTTEGANPILIVRKSEIVLFHPA